MVRGGCKFPRSIGEGQEVLKRARECCRWPGRESECVTEVQGLLE